MMDTEIAKIGGKLASELKLRRNKENRFDLAGGTKTNEGLTRTICRILNENGIKVEIPE